MDIYPLSSLATTLVSETSDEISVWKLIITIFLVFLNGFFVAAEFAIVKVRMSQLQVQQNINSGIASAAKTIVHQLDSYLAATQLGITLASLGLGWVGESSLTPVILKTFEIFGLVGPDWAVIAKNISFPLAFIIITVLHIVFGELAPKSLAIQYPIKTTFAIAWPLRIFYIIFKPVIYVMNGLANVILRAAGIKPVHGNDIHSEEELKMIISESQEGGAIEETERQLIQNVFDFDDRRVNSVMTSKKNIAAIDIRLPIDEIVEYTFNEGYSRYPVHNGEIENIIGILYTKDLYKAVSKDKDNVNIFSLLRKPIYVSETTLIKNVLAKFQKRHLQLAIVTDEIGDLVGVVSLEDILEELVGEIQDEYDNEEPIVKMVRENVYHVDAHKNIVDINRILPIPFEESENYDTLAGLISELYNDVELREKQKIELPGYQGIVLKMYRNSVETIELTISIEKE